MHCLPGWLSCRGLDAYCELAARGLARVNLAIGDPSFAPSPAASAAFVGHRRAEINQAFPDGWPPVGLQPVAAGADSESTDRLPGEGPRPLRPCRHHAGLQVRVWRPSWCARGLAWAFTRYSVDYIDQQEEARIANRGVHAHDCVPAWEWRERQRDRSSR